MITALLKAFGNRRIAAVLLLGFSSGIPLALTGATLQAWMKTEGVDLTTIGLFSLVGLPYTLKFLWSPAMDRYTLPFLGRRRGWIVVTQVLLALSIVALSGVHPTEAPFLTAALAFTVAFVSSSQDIVVDAYRTDVLREEEIGPGASVYILGYRGAMLVSGAVALIMADHMSWAKVYLAMACTLVVGLIGATIAPEPETSRNAPVTLADAVVLPFLEFFKRKGAFEILAFVVFYKLDVVIAQAMMTPFMMDIGFTKTDIGVVTKGFGLVSLLIGVFVGGTSMIRLGLLRSLWVFGLLQGVSGAAFTALAILGHHYPMMVASIAIENFCAGLGTAAYSAFIMSICDKRFTATQYALLTSVMALTRVIGGAPTGWMAEHWGWTTYYIASILAMIPGLLLLTRYSKWSEAEVRS